MLLAELSSGNLIPRYDVEELVCLLYDGMDAGVHSVRDKIQHEELVGFHWDDTVHRSSRLLHFLCPALESPS